MKRNNPKTKSRRLVLASLLLLASLLWLSLAACQNSPARAHERRVAPAPAAEQCVPGAPEQTCGESALERMDSFFNKPLGVELIEK